jgi:hypothetical protein
LKTARQAHPIDFVGGFVINALAIQKNFTTGGSKATADEVEQGGLAGTIGANDSNTLTSVHCQIGTANDFSFTEIFSEIFEF